MKSRFLIFVILVLTATTAHAADKRIIRSSIDIPATHFSLTSAPSKAFTEPAFLTTTLPLLKREAEHIKTDSVIEDPSTADKLTVGLAAIALVQHRAHDAIDLIQQSRQAATKPQQRAIGLLLYDALAVSMTAKGHIDCQRGAAHITALLKANDPDIVRDEALYRIVQSETSSPLFFSGIIKAVSDPGFESKHYIGLLDGLDLARYRALATLLPQCRPAFTNAIRTWAAEPKNSPKDIWASRQPSKENFESAPPVTVAIWDGGYDPALFPGQLAIDPAEPLDGRDNDGDGVVDDWNGPTFDFRINPSSAPYPPPSHDLASQLAFQMALSKGNADLLYGSDTPEAKLFATRARDAQPADQFSDTLLWNEMGDRDHGTAVASEIADGAPFVRLYNIRAINCCNDPQPVPQDEETTARWVKVISMIGPRLRNSGVRIVNISWYVSADDFAEGLLQYGGETDETRAAARGKALFAEADAALRNLVATCPDILFVVGAGNSNQSNDVFAASPQSIVAPNLVVVGAAGTNGRPTSFTTFGDGVAVYAWGEGVPLRMPGGMMTRHSGTSMAAPLVAREAASMLAVNSSLKPAQLIEGIKLTATTGDGGLKLIDPAAAVNWAKLKR